MKKSIFKKITSILTVVVLLASMITPVYAEDNAIKVQLNGEYISFDVDPQMVNNRVLVPVRAIFEKLGADVDWVDETRTITATKDETIIKLVPDSYNALITKNGVEEMLDLDTSPIIIDGRTLVPIRFISESLGVQVGWDAINRTVILIDYSYFLNALKTQVPNFYEFATNRYDQVNTGAINSSGEFTYAISSVDASQNMNGTVNVDLKAKINEENGSMDADVKLTGLEDVLLGSGLEDFDNISFNLRFDNSSFYVKSNLFKIWEEDGINIGEKWIKADFKDLGMPEITSLQDLKEMQSKQHSTEEVFKSLINTPVALDVNSFAEIEGVFNALIALVDNDNFSVTNKGDMKVYKWNIEKEDLIDVVLNIEKVSGDFENMTMEELLEIKEFADSMVFDFNMEVGVKNNIIVNSKTSFILKMEVPDEGTFELSFKSDSEVLHPNDNTYFEVVIPKQGDVINLEDLLSGELEENSQF